MGVGLGEGPEGGLGEVAWQKPTAAESVTESSEVVAAAVVEFAGEELVVVVAEFVGEELVVAGVAIVAAAAV